MIEASGSLKRGLPSPHRSFNLLQATRPSFVESCESTVEEILIEKKRLYGITWTNLWTILFVLTKTKMIFQI